MVYFSVSSSIRVAAILLVLAVSFGGTGCVSTDRLASVITGSIEPEFTNPDRVSATDEIPRNEPDTIFFVDGAGGGGVLIDWSREIQRGLRDAGLRGAFHAFDWQTGLGPIVDQCTSIEYKRARARELAGKIRAARAGRADARIAVVAASAGTAIAVFAVEELGEAEGVDSLVLLSSALSAKYDLSRALRRVRGRAYVFTSPHDTLLRVLVPVLGTADREFVDARIAGLQGFDAPAFDVSGDQYRKIVEIPWRPEWRSLGHAGGHTDCKSPRFVQTVVAPLLASGRQSANQGRSVPPRL